MPRLPPIQPCLSASRRQGRRDYRQHADQLAQSRALPAADGSTTQRHRGRNAARTGGGDRRKGSAGKLICQDKAARWVCLWDALQSVVETVAAPFRTSHKKSEKMKQKQDNIGKDGACTVAPLP